MHNLDYRASSNPRLIEVPNLIEQNDGNNVNLDSQMSEQSKNKVLFDLNNRELLKLHSTGIEKDFKRSTHINLWSQ